jgi:hypothetical protein
VVGPQVYSGEVLAAERMTAKRRRAAELPGKGHDIEVMSEHEFLRGL